FVFAFIFLFLAIDILPAWYYKKVGITQFAERLTTEASSIKPWNEWNVVLLDAESKLSFYLHLPPNVKYLDVDGNRTEQTSQMLQKAWGLNLQANARNTIYISRKLYKPVLQSFYPDYIL